MQRPRRAKRHPPPEPESPPAKISSARELTLADKGKALVAMLYKDNVLEVNLGSVRFNRLLLQELAETGLTPQALAAKALGSVRDRWDVPIEGDEAEQKFRRFLRRLRRDFAVATYLELLTVIRERDDSEDPITV